MSGLASGDVPVAVRRIEGSDLSAVREIEAFYGNMRPWPAHPDFLDHEFEAGRMVLAEQRKEVAGFAGVFDYDDLTYLADLFVRPDLVGRGIGRALLDVILSSTAACATMASSDPRALPLYARFGMRPILPALHLSGGRKDAGRLPSCSSAPLAVSGDAELEDVIELDAAVCGRRRPSELCFLFGLEGTATLVQRSAGRADAYAYVRTVIPQGVDEAEAFIGPCGAASEAGLARITEAAIHYAARAAGRIHVLLLGTHPGLPSFLRAGFRIDDMDILMATNPDFLDGRRYAPSPEFG